MSTAVAISEVVSAYKILFGNGRFSDGFNMPNKLAIRSAYRKKAKLFHPDLAATSSMNEERLQTIFLKISKAYETLNRYIGSSKATNSFDFEKVVHHTKWQPVKPNVPVPVNKTFSSDYYYRGKMPDRKLRFGEFLFYSGIIDWKTFMNALVYQCTNRPMLGAICIDSGFIDQNDVINIMNDRNLLGCEKFGQAAVRLRYLTKKEVSYALRKQHQYFQPFGKYFIDKNLISKKQLQRFLTNFHHRNMRLSA